MEQEIPEFSEAMAEVGSDKSDYALAEDLVAFSRTQSKTRSKSEVRAIEWAFVIAWKTGYKRAVSNMERIYEKHAIPPKKPAHRKFVSFLKKSWERILAQ